MRCILFIVILSLIFAACQPKQDITSDQKAVENVLYNFFDGIAKYDDQLLRAQCATDFVLIELSPSFLIRPNSTPPHQTSTTDTSGSSVKPYLFHQPSPANLNIRI
jgi:hypothetical protein